MLLGTNHSSLKALYAKTGKLWGGYRKNIPTRNASESTPKLLRSQKGRHAMVFAANRLFRVNFATQVAEARCVHAKNGLVNVSAVSLTTKRSGTLDSAD